MKLGALSVTVKQHTETVLPMSWNGRDYVIGEMWKNKPLFCLAMNKATSDDGACKHYTGRGVMKFYDASLVQLRSRTWECLSRGYCQATLKTTQDSDGGLLPAYPSGKSWDEASGKTGSGKRFITTSFREPTLQQSPPMSKSSLQSSTTAWAVRKLMRIQQSWVPDLCATQEVVGGVRGVSR